MGNKFAAQSTPGVSRTISAEEELTGTLIEPISKLEHPAISRLVEPGDRLGRYRVGRILGHGGTGDVFLGYGVSPGSQRRVAVKVLQRGLGNRELRERFDNECRILATLDHPNIARLFDSRAADSVRPYVVMEFVDGERIDAYCDRLRLPVAQRLHLIQEICSAVELAHSRRVVHLDLKPSNILVTGEGVPKLLDFGIAKLIEAGTEGAAPHSDYANHQPMTLGYASPEQIAGKTLTPATDVYSLGMVLYKLLTGRLPFSAARLRCPKERVRFLAERTQPTPPSRAFLNPPPGAQSATDSKYSARIARLRSTTVDGLRAQIEGPVDRLALRAIAHARRERWTSMRAFAKALEGLLAQ